MFPFMTFFSYIADTIIIYCVFSILANRQAVKGSTGLSKASRTLGMIGVILLGLVGGTAIILSIVASVQTINSGVSIYYLYSTLVSTPGVSKARNAMFYIFYSLSTVLAFIAFVFSVLLVRGYKHSGLRSKVSLLSYSSYLKQVTNNHSSDPNRNGSNGNTILVPSFPRQRRSHSLHPK